MQEETGANSADVIRYFKIACEVFQAQQLWQQIEALDNLVAPAIQIEMLLDVRKLIERAMFWLRRNRSHIDSIKAVIDEFSDGVDALQEHLLQHLPGDEKRRLKKAADRLTRAQVPRELAHQIVRLEHLYRCLDIIAVQAAVGHSQKDVMPVYFDLSELLQLDWLLEKINRLPRRDFWQSLARTALRDDLHSENRALAADLLKRSKKTMSVSGRIASWREANQVDIERYLHLIESIQSGVEVEIEQLSVILKELHAMVEKSKARAIANLA
jgi:glutamate dehydrogenase